MNSGLAVEKEGQLLSLPVPFLSLMPPEALASGCWKWTVRAGPGSLCAFRVVRVERSLKSRSGLGEGVCQ